MVVAEEVAEEAEAEAEDAEEDGEDSLRCQVLGRFVLRKSEYLFERSKD